jgi:hypothetical protein
MAPGIAESDWQLFRKLHAVALERFCARLLNEIETASADPETGNVALDPCMPWHEDDVRRGVKMKIEAG